MSFPSSDTHSPRAPPPNRQQSYKYYTSYSQASHHSPSLASSHARERSQHSMTSSTGEVEQGRNGFGIGVQQVQVPMQEEDDGGWTVDWGTPAFERVGERMKRKKARRAPIPTTFGIMQGTPSPPYTVNPSNMLNSTSTRESRVKTPDLSHGSTSSGKDVKDSPLNHENPLPTADIQGMAAVPYAESDTLLGNLEAGMGGLEGGGDGSTSALTSACNGAIPTSGAQAPAPNNGSPTQLDGPSKASLPTSLSVAPDVAGPIRVETPANGAWQVDSSISALPIAKQSQTVEDGGWTVDKEPGPDKFPSPRQIRTVPSASAAISRWLGHLPEARPFRERSSTEPPAQEDHSAQPIQHHVPRHVLAASLHDPNHDPNREPNEKPERRGSAEGTFQTINQAASDNAARPPSIEPDVHADAEDERPHRPSSTFNPFKSETKPGFDQLDLKQAADANAAADSLERTAARDDDGGWSKDAAVKRWAQSVEPAHPAEIHAETIDPVSPSPAATPLAGPINIDDLPSRPTSVAQIPPPITVYVSDDDESDADSPLPTPRVQGRFEQPLASPTVVQARQYRDNEAYEAGLPNSAETYDKAESTRDGSQMTETRRDREYRSRRAKAEKNGAYWKRSPHPAYAPQFADRRVLVKFPFSIRISNMKSMLNDHMARFGNLRMIWTIDATGDAADQALVIFDEPESVAAFMAADDRNICTSRSPNRAGATKFEVQTSIPPINLLSKVVYIKVTGARGDSRSRSASPSLDRSGSGHAYIRESYLRPLPLGIYIDAVPQIHRRKGFTEFWARIRHSHVDFESVDRRALFEAGQHARELAHVDLGRRIQEKEFIPRLCDYLALVVDITPPASKDDGWLVSVGGMSEARSLITELSKITGVTVRLARREETLDRQNDGIHAQADAATQSPISRHDQLPGGGAHDLDTMPVAPTSPTSSRPTDETVNLAHAAPLETGSDGWPKAERQEAEGIPIKIEPANPEARDPQHGERPAGPVDAEYSNIPSAATRGGSAALGADGSDRRSGQGQPGQQQHSGIGGDTASNQDGEHNPQDPNGGGDAQQPSYEQYASYSSLTKRLEYTYRGRILRMDNSGSEPRFYDDAGVFVGRLCQDREDAHSLFARFSRYGYICDIEYKVVPTAVYGSARILFGDVASAQRALAYESGSTNYGSVLKIDKRRVLQTDVELKEYMVDDFGRAYSPTMVPQYTPPRQGTIMPTTVPASFPRPEHPIRTAPPMPIAPPSLHAPVPHGIPVHTPSPSVPTPMPSLHPAHPAPPVPSTWPWPMPMPQTAPANEAIANGMNAILYALGVTYWPGEGPPPPAQPHPLVNPVVSRHAAPPLGSTPVPTVQPPSAPQQPMEMQPPPGFAVLPVSPMEPTTTRLPAQGVTAYASPVAPASSTRPPTGPQPSDPAAAPLAVPPTDPPSPIRSTSGQAVYHSPQTASPAPPMPGHLQPAPVDVDATPLATPRPPRRLASPAAPTTSAQTAKPSPENPASHSASATPPPAEPPIPRRSDSPVFPRLSTPDRKSDGALSNASNLGSSTSSSGSLRVKKSIITPSGLHKWVYEDEDYERHCRETGKEHKPLVLREQEELAQRHDGAQSGHGDPAYPVQQDVPAFSPSFPSVGTRGEMAHAPRVAPYSHVDPDAQVAISPNRPFAALSASSSHSGDHHSPYRLEAQRRPFDGHGCVPPSASTPIMQHHAHRPNPVPIPFVDQIPLQSGQWASQGPPPAHSPVHHNLDTMHHRIPQQHHGHPGRLSSANNSMPPPGFQRQWGAPSAPEGSAGGGWYVQPGPHSAGAPTDLVHRGHEGGLHTGFDGRGQSGSGPGSRIETGSDGWERSG